MRYAYGLPDNCNILNFQDYVGRIRLHSVSGINNVHFATNLSALKALMFILLVHIVPLQQSAAHQVAKLPRRPASDMQSLVARLIMGNCLCMGEQVLLRLTGPDPPDDAPELPPVLDPESA